MSSNSLRVGLAISYDDEQRQEQRRGAQDHPTLTPNRTPAAAAHHHGYRPALSAVRRPR
jgi:hypothetical protein